jgi:hypothetical protein
MKIEITLEDAVKIRDHTQAIADTWNEIIDRHAPTAVTINKPTQANFNALNWIKKTGSKGEYEQAVNDNSEAFRTLQMYLKESKGFTQLFGFKVWIHNNDENTIDRRG